MGTIFCFNNRIKQREALISLFKGNVYLFYFFTGVFIHSKLTIDKTFDIFERKDVDLLPVTDDRETRHPLGIVTQRDVLTVFREVK